MIYKYRYPLLILLIIVLSVSSFIAGRWWGLKIYPPKLSNAQVIQSVKESIALPQKEWGTIVKSGELDFTLEGEIVKIKEGITNGREQGREISLKKENNQATVFVSNTASVYSGTDFLEQSSWKAASITDLQVGNTVIIRVNSPIAVDTNPTTRFFRGWWIYKQL